MTGFLLFGSFIVLLILGVPIAVSLAMATMSAIIFSPDITLTLSVVTQRIFGGLDSTSIMAIAFFVLAGNIMTKGGISRRLVEFANCIVGGFRGGMSLAMVLACAFFAALSGSAPATVVAIGYGASGIFERNNGRASGCGRRTWSDNSAVYYHGGLLYHHRRVRGKNVQRRHGNRIHDCSGSDGNHHFLCPQRKVAQNF